MIDLIFIKMSTIIISEAAFNCFRVKKNGGEILLLKQNHYFELHQNI